jgi:trehalose synthase-fused probable maltokinase
MHLALAAGESKSFAPEPFTKLYQQGLYQSLRAQARRRLDLLRRQQENLPAEIAPQAQWLLMQEEALLQEFRELAERPVSALRTRCHGDFHLGQVLFTGKDFVIIDFEGEPDRPISERRIKASPLRDVAGMIRSFHYATHAVRCGPLAELQSPAAGGPDLAAWLSVWYTWTSAAYLKAYLAEASSGGFLPSRDEDLQTLLKAYLLEKALYELGYELNNRPTWVRIPLEGILQLMGTTESKES